MASNILESHEKFKKQERLVANPGAGKFTLKRNDMKYMQDMKLCSQFCDWITELSGIEVFPDTFIEDLSDGVALLRVTQKFGQIGTYHELPKTGGKLNPFKARENRAEFIRACNRLDIHALPEVEFTIHNLIPCLLELAAIAESFKILETPNKSLPDGIRRRVSTVLMQEQQKEIAHAIASDDANDIADSAVEEAKVEPSIPVISVDTNTSESASALEQINVASVIAVQAPPPPKAVGEDLSEKVNQMLNLKDNYTPAPVPYGRPAPPKQRQLEIASRKLSVLERPGESMGSIVWTGSLVLIEFLAQTESQHLSNGARVLELGAGVGVVGIWCSTLGAHVTVTDRADSMDLLWANVAANANQIVANGGSCVARALSWNDAGAVEKVKASLIRTGKDTEATKGDIYLDIIVASDVVYGDTVAPLAKTIGKLFSEFDKPVRLYICYKNRSEHERMFFETLDMEHGIRLKEVGRGLGERSDYIIFSAIKAGSQGSDGAGMASASAGA